MTLPENNTEERRGPSKLVWALITSAIENELEDQLNEEDTLHTLNTAELANAIYDRILSRLINVPEQAALGDAMRYGLAKTEVLCSCGDSTRKVGIGPTDYQLYRLANPDPEGPLLSVPSPPVYENKS